MDYSKFRYSRMSSLLAATVFMLLSYGAGAQLFYNNGATVYVNTSAIVQVNGDVRNLNTGQMNNLGDVTITGYMTNDATAGGDGTYHVSGDFTNNNTFNAGLGTVELKGATQLITGTSSTHFHDLLLTGTGTKTLGIDTYVNHLLALNDRELATNAFTMFVDAAANITNNPPNGFLSSLSGGTLSRATAAATVYFFPVGSSIGTTRYRPVNITPVSANADSYTVRMVNNDATTDGYNRSNIDSTICQTLANYYHMIDRTAGSDAADVSINFDPVSDGNWQGIARWKTPATQWQTLGTATVAGNFVTKSAWNDYTYKPYILTRKKANANIFPVGPYCANAPADTMSAMESGGQWSGTGITSPGTGIFDPSQAQAGDNLITYTISGVCGDTATTMIHVYSIPDIADSSNNTSCITATDGTIDLTITGGTPAYTYSWNNGLPPSAHQTDLTPNTYLVNVEDANHCVVTKSFDILAGAGECIPERIYIPNVFSPNNDMQNDFFKVYGHGIKSISIIIYDRWGERVYETTDPNDPGWDGTFRGKKLDAGVFVYYVVAEMNSGTQHKVKGNITLIR